VSPHGRAETAELRPEPADTATKEGGEAAVEPTCDIVHSGVDCDARGTNRHAITRRGRLLTNKQHKDPRGPVPVRGLEGRAGTHTTADTNTADHERGRGISLGPPPRLDPLRCQGPPPRWRPHPCHNRGE
jgi:hypothetical protein